MISVSIRSRTVVLAVLMLAIGLSIGASEASALTCFGGPAASALNQYCETVPTSSGHHGSSGGPGAPSGGSTTLGSSLPKRVVQQLTAPTNGSSSTPSTAHGAKSPSSGRSSRKSSRNAAAAQPLLTLPAATIHPGATRLSTAGVADVWSPILVLLVVMAVLGLLMGGLAFALRRRSASS